MSAPFATVPGEDLPLMVPLGLTILSVLFAGATVKLWATPSPAPGEQRPAAVSVVLVASAQSSATPPAPSHTATLTEASPPLGQSAAAAPIAEAASTKAAATVTCEPMLVDFPSGSATPSQLAADQLRKRAAFVLADPKVSVVIDGHSDSLGSDDLNLRLSKRRAEALAWVLENAGVERARVTSRGFGAFLPIEGAVEAADINRRGVIHFRGGCPNDLVRKVEP